MKHSFIRLICLFCATIPMAASSQTNIIAAFDDIINCKDASITESHSLERDPSTNAKIGQCDIWTFSLPANKAKLVKNVISAFDKDSAKAYSIYSGTTAKNSKDIAIAIGPDGKQSVYITEPGYDYFCYSFLAPLSEDLTGNYRYAYGMNYIQADGKINGKLVVTYATTLKYRQEQQKNNKLSTLKQLSGGSIPSTVFASQQQSWFGTLMSYLQGMPYADKNTRIALATKAYKHIQNINDDTSVSELDKNTARDILGDMISDKEYSNPVLNRLLNACMVGIK